MNSTTLMPAASARKVTPAAEAVRARSPYAGLAAVQACSAPVASLPAAHGTSVSDAVFLIDGPATKDAQGSPPREAPV